MPNFQALPLTRTDIDPIEFWSRVEQRDAGECWPWTGSINAQGYGRLRVGGREIAAHRASCVLHGVELALGQVIDHLCRNRRCVNPAHLEQTSVAVNTARGEGPTAELALARLNGMCVNGHVLSIGGLHKQRSGFTCAECGRARVRQHKARKARASA